MPCLFMFNTVRANVAAWLSNGRTDALPHHSDLLLLAYLINRAVAPFISAADGYDSRHS